MSRTARWTRLRWRSFRDSSDTAFGSPFDLAAIAPLSPTDPFIASWSEGFACALSSMIDETVFAGGVTRAIASDLPVASGHFRTRQQLCIFANSAELKNSAMKQWSSQNSMPECAVALQRHSHKTMRLDKFRLWSHRYFAVSGPSCGGRCTCWNT